MSRVQLVCELQRQAELGTSVPLHIVPLYHSMYRGENWGLTVHKIFS